jgi:hypothetical protein
LVIAHLLVDCVVGHGGAAVRVSIGLGMIDEHVDRLLTALAALDRDGSGEPRREPPAAGLAAAAR